MQNDLFGNVPDDHHLLEVFGVHMRVVYQQLIFTEVVDVGDFGMAAEIAVYSIGFFGVVGESV